MEMNEEYKKNKNKNKPQLQTYFWYLPLSRTLVTIVYVFALILDNWTPQELENKDSLPDWIWRAQAGLIILFWCLHVFAWQSENK